MLVTKGALANILGISSRHLTRLHAEGLPIAEHARGRKGNQYDLTKVVPWYIDYKETIALSSSEAQDAREALYRAQTERTQLEVQKTRRNLIEIEEAGRALLAVVATYNSTLQGVAPRAAAAITTNMNTAEKQHAISREIATARQSIAAELETWAELTTRGEADQAATG